MSLLRLAPAKCERRCVHADLSGPWTQALLEAGFDPGTPTIWVAEGLFFYLTADDVESLLSDAAALSAGGAIFLADIFGTGLLDLQGMGPLVAACKSAGRPLPFCTNTPEALFRLGGWSEASVVQPGQPAANFGRLIQTPEAVDGGRQNNLRTYLVTGGRPCNA